MSTNENDVRLFEDVTQPKDLLTTMVEDLRQLSEFELSDFIDENNDRLTHLGKHFSRKYVRDLARRFGDQYSQQEILALLRELYQELKDSPKYLVYQRIIGSIRAHVVFKSDIPFDAFPRDIVFKESNSEQENVQGDAAFLRKYTGQFINTQASNLLEADRKDFSVVELYKHFKRGIANYSKAQVLALLESYDFYHLLFGGDEEDQFHQARKYVITVLAEMVRFSPKLEWEQAEEQIPSWDELNEKYPDVYAESKKTFQPDKILAEIDRAYKERRLPSQLLIKVANRVHFRFPKSRLGRVALALVVGGGAAGAAAEYAGVFEGFQHFRAGEVTNVKLDDNLQEEVAGGVVVRSTFDASNPTVVAIDDATQAPSATPLPSNTPAPTQTFLPSQTPLPSESPGPSAVFEQTDTVVPSATPSPSPSPTPSTSLESDTVPQLSGQIVTPTPNYEAEPIVTGLAGSVSEQLPVFSVEQTEQLNQVNELVSSMLQGKEVGFYFARYNQNDELVYEVSQNEQEYYEVASTFKFFVVLYYFMNTPESEWQYLQGSDIYSVAVHSNNLKTAEVLAHGSNMHAVGTHDLHVFLDGVGCDHL